jgi:hypothetical protein
MAKETPTLLDMFLRTGILAHEPSKMRLRMRMAKSFVLDDEASEFLGYILKSVGPMVLREHEFARAPYDQTWVELNFRAYARNMPVSGPEVNADTRLGYFFDNDDVWCVAESPAYKDPSMMPFSYQLHRPISMEEELQMAQFFGTSRLMYRQAILGYVGVKDGDWWLSTEASNVCRSHRFVVHDALKDVSMQGRYGVLTSAAGTLKQIIALGLLLSRSQTQRIINYTEIGPRRAFIRAKQVALVKHNVVSLHLGPKRTFQKFTRYLETGGHKKFHDVRGHWAQTRKLDQSCEHSWDALDVNHFTCVRCGSNRWWRKAHQRGDINLGTVTKHYEVKE